MVIKFPKQQWKFCLFGPLTEPSFGRIPSWPSSWSRFLQELDCRGRRSNWSRLIMEPDYRGQKPSWSRFLPELDYHGWGSSWSQLLTELDYHGPSSWSRFPEGSRLPQTNTLDMVQGLSSPSRKVRWLWEPDYCWQLSWSRLSELDYCRQSGSRLLQQPDNLWQVSGHEFWDQSWGSIFFGSWGYCGRPSSWSQFTGEPVCREPTWRPPGGDGSFRSRSDAVCSHSYSKWQS